MEWHAGDVSGMLPYSRMKGPPGDNRVEVVAEVFTVHQDHFPELIHRCPVFTGHTVHIMVDRARSFNTSDLQDEKMISLGKLAAGLAHELNNPASALVRSAKQMTTSLEEMDQASRELGAAGLPKGLLRDLEQLRSVALAEPAGTILSPIQLADREDEIADWLEQRNLDVSYAASLGEMDVTIEALDAVVDQTSAEKLEVAVRWLTAILTTDSLAGDVEHASGRVYDLVSAVKQFTYMDKLDGPESVDVETGLRDTIRVLESKAKAKGAAPTAPTAAYPRLPRR
jgi:hypothetical protein